MTLSSAMITTSKLKLYALDQLWRLFSSFIWQSAALQTQSEHVSRSGRVQVSCKYPRPAQLKLQSGSQAMLASKFTQLYPNIPSGVRSTASFAYIDASARYWQHSHKYIRARNLRICQRSHGILIYHAYCLVSASHRLSFESCDTTIHASVQHPLY